MNKIILLLFIIFFVSNNSNSQEYGTIKICEDFNKESLQCKNEHYLIYPSYIWVIFETNKDSFGEMSLVERIIEIVNSEEIIYSSSETEIEPDWSIIWDYKYLPNGVYMIKYYNKSGILLAKSKKFIIHKI